MKKLTLNLVLLSLASVSARATVHTVCASGCGYTTIQAAVNAASPGDTIHINRNGTHFENGISITKSLTFKGNGIGTTAVDGSDLARIFLINPSSAATILMLDMTIQNGKAGPTVGDNSGGGVCIAGAGTSDVTFRNVRFYSNELSGNSAQGAGLSTAAGTTTITLNMYNCEFVSNRANAAGLNQGGAGMALGGTTGGIIANTLFNDNIAEGSGGAIIWSGVATNAIVNCTFSNNQAVGGFASNGGASNSGSAQPVFTGCTFSNNTSTHNGGAVRCAGATFNNCTFYGNTSATGGAISRSTGSSSNALKVVNCTIANNTGTTAGGGFHSASTTALIHLVNSILANNTSGAGADLNLPNATVLSTNATNYVGSHNVSGPSFLGGTLGLSGTLSNNGGLTQTLALSGSSSLINAGTASVAGVTIPEKDQRNYTRDGVLSVGAYEYNGTDDLSISYTLLGDALASSNPGLTVTITDPVGVAAGGLAPRIYFRKGSSGEWYSAAGTLASGVVQSGTWNFTIDHSQLGTLLPNDVVSYFVVAQDQSAGAVVKSLPAGVIASDVKNLGTTPTPNSYTIVSALPVTLVSFAGHSAGRENILSWQTAREEGTSHFEIQRSTDGAGFSSIGRMAAKNTAASYSFADADAPAVAYYRLKAVDVDGSMEYSRVVVLKREAAMKAGIAVYPNPASEKLTIEASGATDKASVVLCDLSGKTIASASLVSGKAHFDMSALPSGAYMLRYQDSDRTEVIKIMKQ